LVDLPDPLLAYSEVRKLENLRQAAILARIDADLALGRHVEVVAELEELVNRWPGHEDGHRLLALAYYRWDLNRQRGVLAGDLLASARPSSWADAETSSHPIPAHPGVLRQVP
jgi:hypothetical protein